MSLPAPRPDTTILITGASAGIGTELARGLARRGHNLVLTARREDRLLELAEELRRAHGIAAEVHARDLGDDAARAELVRTVRGGERALVGLCNNAGFGTFGKFHALPIDTELSMIRLNVLALVELAGEFLPEMVRRGEGAVLNVSSVAAFQPLPANATYAATKAFVSSFTEAIHAELAGTGVSCSALCPGPVETEFGEVAGVGEQESQLPGFMQQTAEEVAEVGIEAMIKGKRSVFPGMGPRAAAFGGRFVPRSALLPIARRLGDRMLPGD